MDNSQLIEYVKASRAGGQNDDQIRHNLVSNGWQQSLVDAALSNPDVPVSGPHNSQFVPARNKKSLTSPFSLLLAIVLTGTLFVLTNRIISDVNQAYGVAARLIIDACIVVPFLLVAFILHFSLGEKNPKYLILSRPYYIIAAWLLIRLLWEVSTYLLDKNSAYGVYVVLILIIAVLTFIVIFVQKYLRK